MNMEIFQSFQTYFLAILLGALMGMERERKELRSAGLRTFILVVLLGSICGTISEAGGGGLILLAGTLAVAAHSCLGQIPRIQNDSKAGLTTSVALLVAFGIGVMVAFGEQKIAIALSIGTTIILYFKPQMHRFTHAMSERDLQAMFQFGLLAFIILPVLPDQNYGPFNSINPHNIWLMVVMISGLNLFGYVTIKLVSQRWGGPFLGVLGGIVSSTATTLSISRHTSKSPEFSLTGSVVVSLASIVGLIRVGVLVWIIYPRLLGELIWVLVAMLICGLVPVVYLWQKNKNSEVPVPETKNPVELKQALLFGFLYAVILVAVSAGKTMLGDKGVYLISLVSGLTDVDAITLSNSRLADTGVLDLSQAGNGIIIAFISNLAFKLGLIGAIANMKIFRMTLLCFGGLAFPALATLLYRLL